MRLRGQNLSIICTRLCNRFRVFKKAFLFMNRQRIDDLPPREMFWQNECLKLEFVTKQLLYGDCFLRLNYFRIIKKNTRSEWPARERVRTSDCLFLFSWFGQPFTDSVKRSLGSVGQLKFFQYAAYVFGNGPVNHVESGCNLRVAQTSGDQP